MSETFTIRKGDDFHCHLREGSMLQNVVGFTARRFKRAVVMPNLSPPVLTPEDAREYCGAILECWPNGFEPIMTIMLTKQTTPEIVSAAARQGIRILKYIPEGVSTNSEASIPLEKLPEYYPVLEAARDEDMVFSGHWESSRGPDGKELNDADREAAAIPFLEKVIKFFPGMRVIVEHASTIEMIDYVRHSSRNVGCTLTVHHALLNYQDVCDDRGRIKNPHCYCKPILKSEHDRRAVLRAMISGDPHFFFGSDSAPHLRSAKKRTPPAAGIFSAPVALPLLAEIFEKQGSLDKIEDFVSTFGADFYRLPQNTETIELVKRDRTVPDEYNGIVPFMAGRTLRWTTRQVAG